MERLTRRNEQNTGYYYPKCFEECDGMGTTDKCNSCNITSDVCERLGRYEDAEEQGILFKLPCKVGDTIWIVINGEICEHRVTCISINTQMVVIEAKDMDSGIYRSLYAHKIGESYFLTKEEAEQKVKELMGERQC